MSYLQQLVMADMEADRIRNMDFDWRNPYSASSLSKAVRSMDIPLVKKLIRKGSLLNAPDNRGWTPLHEAAINDNFLKIAQHLISAGAYIDHKTVDGETALFIACKNGAEAIVKSLLNAGSQVNTQNNEGATALHIAASRKNEAIIRHLISAGASLDAEDHENRTPIFLAIENVSIQALNVLIEAGSDMKTTDSLWRTPLQYACMIGNLEIFNTLIELLGRDKSVIDHQTPEGWTPLMEAVQYKNFLIAEKLIEYGADTALVDNRQLLALHIAAHCERYNLIELLLRNTPKKYIEKYAILSAKNTHQSLPCLIIDKNLFEGLELLFQSGLNEDVLKCPVMMGNQLYSPISFLLLFGSAVVDEDKIKFLEFLLTFDFLIDPQYKQSDQEIRVVSPIEAAIGMHHSLERDDTCYCIKYLAMILAKGASPDDIHNLQGDLSLKKQFVFQKAIKQGFIAGLDLLLKYSDDTEPEDLLRMILKDICNPKYEWSLQEKKVVEYLIGKCSTHLGDTLTLALNALAPSAFENNKYFELLSISEILKSRIRVPSLQKQCRYLIRNHAREHCKSTPYPFKNYIQNIDLPLPLTKFLLYEVGF